MFDIAFSLELVKTNNFFRIEYHSTYCGGSYPVNDIQDFIRAVNGLFGVGSYVFYHRPTMEFDYPVYDTYPKAISPFDYEKYGNLPRVSHLVDSLRTDFIEKSREQLKEVWGDIPELRIGWLENQFKTYVD